MAVVRCWNCRRELDVPLPVGRRECCPHCDADLRCCRGCMFHDPAYARECREPVAEAVVEKSRANTCDFFRPGGSTAGGGQDEAGAARDKLARMFGQDTGGERRAGESEADAARRRLDDLFGKKPR